MKGGTCGDVDMAREAPAAVADEAKPEPCPGPGTKSKGHKACFVCGSLDHLRAECPHAKEIRKQESWLEILQGDSCMLPAEEVPRQIAATESRLAALQAEAAAKKERAVLPEQLLATRRAEVQKRMTALATARSSLEDHEKLLRDLVIEGDRLRGAVADAASAFRQAESALEEAERRLADSIARPRAAGSAASPPPASAPSAPPNTLSTRGIEALKALEMHIQGLTSSDTLGLVEQEYQQLQAEAAGKSVPSLLAFVMGKLQREGARQLQTIGFELTKEPAILVTETTPASEHSTLRPERPRRGGGLGDDRRLPQRVHKPLTAESARDSAAALAEALRAERQPRPAPAQDPLWAAVCTAAAGTPVPAVGAAADVPDGADAQVGCGWSGCSR